MGILQIRTAIALQTDRIVNIKYYITANTHPQELVAQCSGNHFVLSLTAALTYSLAHLIEQPTDFHDVTGTRAQVSTMPAEELARRFEDAGAAAIIYTDIDRDGMLGGVNLEQTLALARAVALPVIASGGVASLDDLAALSAVATEGIEGVIIGRALYDGRVDPAAALALVEG